MARNYFDQQLTRLQYDVVRLGSMVDKMLGRSVTALVERDVRLAEQVIAEDSEVDALAYAVEDEAMTLISLQQPVATDLRRIAAALVIAQELERMGDHAEGIAKVARDLANQPAMTVAVDVVGMVTVARRMLQLALQAYIDTDCTLASHVWAMDNDLDCAYTQATGTLLASMMDDPSTIERATHWQHVVHDLERVGDRVTNICERVVYIITGEAAYVHTPARRAS